ncbi:anti-sigma-F factor Fin family protein [Halalkalibacter sp. AB-rgal2]|uniref:Fin: required for the switch from sigmaF to sigmaG during sporulation n=1 Tax=Halalkalibacter hemicellulosilyticusJCM 9152 TaxID=1236971 RepID=W4QK67_9BACI|nr:anti-sigma-F factor Fin family protein [Halalkalibacter hemicellulosilyticus]GAE31749.1 Fin: required for the switch from sigmaF to sigmaG during sporulation [Halalkalibacter hemicellulosilyticusJCM 9152]
MAIHYQCRHCHAKVGTIEHSIHANVLGFDMLTSTERTEMVSYLENGDIHVKVICEDCHEALIRNPDLHEVDIVVQ